MSELPEGWARVSFFSFCVLQRGYDLPLSKTVEGLYPVVTSAGVAARHTEFKAPAPGVITGRSGSIGNVFFIDSNYWPHNTTLFVRDFKGNEPKFVYYFLLGFNAGQYSSSTAVPTLNRNNLRDLCVHVPPLVEQRRIALKLGALLARVNACRERLDKIPKLLARFRQSVLAAACSGRLTEDWRTNKSNLPALEANPPENAPSIPNTWNWHLLSEIANIRGGVTKGRKLNGSQTVPLPYLRVANVQDGFLNLAEIKEIDVLPREGDKYRLEPGDILFTEGGDRDKLGRGAVWGGEVPHCIHQNHIFRARVRPGAAVPAYVSLTSKSEFSRQFFFDKASQTVNLASLSLTNLGLLPIPLPPFPEQQEIVRRVDQLFAFADRLEARVETARKRVDALTPSILAKAFRGELVPTEAELAEAENRTFESAAELLARIRSLNPQVKSSAKNKTQQKKARKASAAKAATA